MFVCSLFLEVFGVSTLIERCKCSNNSLRDLGCISVILCCNYTFLHFNFGVHV